MERSAKTAALLILLLLAVGVSVPASSAEAGGPTFQPASGDEPGSLWLSAEDAVSNGGLNTYLLGESAVVFDAQRRGAKIETQEAIGDTGVGVQECTNLAWWNYGKRPPTASFEEFVRRSAWVLEGTVQTAYPGFLQGEFGSLVQVRLGGVLFRPGPITPPDLVYFFTLNVNHTLAGERICSLDPRFPYVPQPGDKVILLSTATPLDVAGSLFYPTQVFIESKPGRVYSSGNTRKNLRAMTLPSIRAAIAYIERIKGERAVHIQKEIAKRMKRGGEGNE